MLDNIRHFIRQRQSPEGPQGTKGTTTEAGSGGGGKIRTAQHNVDEYKPLATQMVEDEATRERARQEKSRKNIERYQIKEKVGEGAFSVVYRALDTQTKRSVAVKVIKKYQLDEKQRRNVMKEVGIMQQLSHPNVVTLVDFIENDEYYYIVQELVAGGEIFNEVVNFTYFSEDLARHVIVQVAEALLYLHEHLGIVHRDLKPENIFFKPIKIIPSERVALRRSDNPATKKDEGKFTMNYGGGGIGVVKIGDFGLSKQLQLDVGDLKTPCGTVGYTAPEIVKDQRYSKEVDVWALGCVLYILLCGFPPFFNDNIDELTRAVAKGKFEFLSPWWDEISQGAKQCVSRLLTVDPRERYTLRQFMQDPWIMEFLNRSEGASHNAEQKRQNAQQPTVVANEFQAPHGARGRRGPSAIPMHVAPSLHSSYSDTLVDPMDIGVELSRMNHRELYTPAVIAMKEAMDITNATLRDRERDGFEEELRKKTPSKEFALQLDASSILARRRKAKA